MNRARVLLAGAGWSYGSQLVTATAQFGYAALTTRIVSAGDFGVYAVALSVSALVTLLATGGMAQTVGRIHELSNERLRALVSYSLLLGSGAALVLFLTADFWSWVWGVEDAAEPIRWLAIGAATAPVFSLVTGYLRRLGRFRSLATTVTVGNIVAMVVGACAVALFRTPSSLLVSPICAQLISLIVALVLAGPGIRGLGALRGAAEEIGFSWKLTVASLASYLNGNIARWGVVRFIGSASFGLWNRAEVLTVVPFSQVQQAVIQVIYPEFRHHIGAPDVARRIWSDLQRMIAWAVLPIATAVALLVPIVVPFLFGQGWEAVIPLLAPLAIASGLQITSSVLASAVEALGRFRWVWMAHLFVAVVQIVAVILTILTETIAIAMVAVIVTQIVRHAVHLWFCGRAGYIDTGEVMRSYLRLAVACGLIATAIWGTIEMVRLMIEGGLLWGVPLILLLAGSVGSAMIWWNRYPPIQIARKYRLF